MAEKIRYPKKGAAKRVSEAFNKIRKEPLPKEAFDIVEEDNKRRQKEKSDKRVAVSKISKDAEL